MSAIDDGPGGYDYQYLSSIYVILLFIKQGELDSVFIDRLDQEDLTLLINKQNKTYTYDFEFKNRRASLDQSFFADCLTKFSPRRSNENVLSKLIDGKLHKYFLFSSARVEGFADQLKITGDKYSFNQVAGKRKKGDLNMLLRYVGQTYSTATKGLDLDRRQFVMAQEKQIKAEELEKILDNVLILDQLPKVLIHELIGHLLTTQYIPVHIQQTVTTELFNLIKDSRATGQNILQQFHNTLTKYIQNLPNSGSDYIVKGNEVDLLIELENKHLLLLTGAPLCGKTQTALYVARSMVNQDRSVSYMATTDIRQAEKFLLTNVNEARLCYLEDPFGEFHHAENVELHKQLNSLLTHLPKDKQRFLIVTSKLEHVEALNAGYYLTSQKWFDVTVISTDFLVRLWADLSLQYQNLTQEYIGLVKRTLKNDKAGIYIQPGQLIHLALFPHKLLAKTQDGVRHLANFRSADLSNYVIEKGDAVIQAMQTVGVASTTQTGLRSADLKYLSDPDHGYLPGINDFEVKFTSSSLFGTTLTEDYHLPEYRSDNVDDRKVREGLDRLIDLRLIKFDQGQYRFVHPIYQEAARNLLDPTRPARYDHTKLLLHKTIGGLNLKAALQTIKNLYLIIGECRTDDQKLPLLEIGYVGIRSTFIAVRDQSLLFLINNFENLPKEMQIAVTKRIEQRGEYKTSTYKWDNDIPFVPNKERTSSDMLAFFERYNSKRKTLKRWYKFITGEYQPNTYQSWNLLGGIYDTTKNKKQRIDLPIEPLIGFLNFEETFIRERAAFLIAASLKDENAQILFELYDENDPFVTYQLIRGLFRSWPYFTDSGIKKQMKEFMVSKFDNAFIVLNAINLFTQFSAGHSSHAFDWRDDIEDIAERDMWLLWGDLMILFFKHLPAKLNINVSRFQSTLSEAKVPIEVKFGILEAYLIWLPNHIRQHGYNTSLATTAIYFLTNNIKEIEPGQRRQLIRKFFSVPQLMFKGTLWRYLVYHWYDLSPAEHTDLEAKIRNASAQEKVIAVTSRNCPDTLQTIVFGKTLHGLSVVEKVKIIPEKMMLMCLSSLYLHPATIDLEYKDQKAWDGFLLYFIDKPSLAAFKIALAVFFVDIFVWRHSRDKMWDSKWVFNELLSIKEPTIRVLIFDHLMSDIVNSSSSDAGIYMNLFYDSCSDQEKKIFGPQFLEYLEAISSHQNLKAIPADAYNTYVKSKLVMDQLILHVLDPKFEVKDDAFFDGFSIMIFYAMEIHEVHTLKAIQRFREFIGLNKKIFGDEKKKIMDDLFEAFQETSSTQMRRIEQKVEISYSAYFGF